VVNWIIWLTEHLNALLLKVITIYVEVSEVSTITVLQNKDTAEVHLNYDVKLFSRIIVSWITCILD